MSSPNGISSDLTAASRLSRRLVGERVADETDDTDGTTDRDAGQYVRFQARGAALREVLPAVEEAVLIPVPDREAISTWPEFLAWCTEVTGGAAALVIDSQGFIIAASDDDVREQYRGAGAELGYAAEQLARFDNGAGELRTIDVEYRRRRVSILCVGGDETLLITLVSSAPIAPQVKSLILEQASIPA